MKQLYYVVQTLLHGRNANVIKIVSLGLGLMMSILLFARVAFDLSMDTCFKDYRNLYQVWSVFTIKGKSMPPQQKNLGPLTGAIFHQFPDEVESAVTINSWALPLPLYNGDKKFDEITISADSLFFETMGIEVLKGNPRQDLQQKDVVYLSERLAKRIFGEENPTGKILRYGDETDFTVKGVFATLPENSTLHAEVVVSMPTVWARNINYGWSGGDSWEGYVRVKPDTDIESLNKRIEQIIEQNIPASDNFSIKAYIQSMYDTFQGYKDVQRRRIITSLLAGAILFIAAMNYVLISISSLSRRAKAIGVHKCSGAETGTIFGMFLWETAIIIFFAILLMVFLVLNFQDFIEECVMDGFRLESFFISRIMWIPLAVVALLFCIGGILPAQLFARIPVTQVFKRYTEGKKGWKRPLLFVQFAGVAFVAGLTCVIWMQLGHINNLDLGYNKERVAVCGHSFSPEEAMTIKHFYEELPYVEAVTSSGGYPIWGYSGEMVSEIQGQALFSTRFDYWIENYPSFMGMSFVQGRMPREKDEVAVNETFVRKMNWSSDVLGKTFFTDLGRVKVVGVVKNFMIGSVYFTQDHPFVAHYHPTFIGKVHVRLKEPFAENLQRLNQDVSEAFAGVNANFSSLDVIIHGTYGGLESFGKVTTVATIIVLFITLMGLIGYTNDETQRRSKEIAIRKVNGAEASGILELLAKDVLVTALPAVLLGTLASWYVGELWMSQFATVVGSTIPYYIMTALVTLLMIVGVVVVKTWKIANENPVISIKSE